MQLFHLLNLIEGGDSHVATDGGCPRDLVYAARGVLPLCGLEGAWSGEGIPAHDEAGPGT